MSELPDLMAHEDEGPAERTRERLQQDLRPAMKARDKPGVAVLRRLIATIDNAEAAALSAETGHRPTRGEGRFRPAI